jgi:hypothetical protein
MNTRLITNTINTKTTKSSRPYSCNFQQNLINSGVYPNRYKYPDGRVLLKPDNLKEINEILIQPRPSLSPSQFSNKNFEEFQEADVYISKENKVTKTVILIIKGKIIDHKCIEGDVLFTNLTPLTDDLLILTKSDLYHDARLK